MDIIIYAQALKIDVPGDVYYKNKYIDKNSDEDINMSKFFKEIEILNRSEEKDLEKVRAKSKKTNYKYLYLEIPCIEKDDDGRYSPIIIQAYHKDVDKIFEALNEFLEKSNRDITEESRKAIEKEIKNFKEERKAFRAAIGSVIFAAIGAAAIGAATIGIAKVLNKNSSKTNSNKETDIKKEENNVEKEKEKDKDKGKKH